MIQKWSNKNRLIVINNQKIEHQNNENNEDDPCALL